MEILKALLWLIGVPGTRNGSMANRRNRRRVSEPERLDLSSCQREQIETRIGAFTDDPRSVYSHAYEAVAREKALPLFFDWTGFMALRLDGQIAWIPYDDEPGEIELVREELLRNIGLFRGSQLHPDLSFLMPRKPSDAVDCPDCRGTGEIAFPPGLEHLSETVRCYCGGIGWLPLGEVRKCNQITHDDPDSRIH
jgi:hypothetical protein